MVTSLEKASGTMTIGKYLLEALYAKGIRHIFGIPGDYVLRLDKLIEEHKGIQFINATRENTAGYMADAYARFKGLGCVCITYGVGLNIVNAMSQAFVEDSPVILISGTAGTDEFAKHPILHHLINSQKNHSQDFDITQLSILKNITVAQAVLTNPETAAEQIDKVIETCLREKKPVYIEIPRDRVESIIPSHKVVTVPPAVSDPAALNEALEETVKILGKSEKPLLWIGHELSRYALAEDALRFAEKYQIPIVSSLLGKTVISEKHPLFAGVYSGVMSRPEVQKLVEQTDCLILLGVKLSDMDTGMFTAKLDHELKIFGTMEEIAINNHEYSKVQFEDFIKALPGLNLKKSFHRKTPSSNPVTEFKPVPNKPTTIARFFECLQAHLKPDSVVFTDVGDCMFGSADLVLDRNSFQACAFFASLGFGTPGSIATQLALPEKRIIGIIGDGAFQMTCMELSTAVRYKLDPVIIVLNNHGYGTERPLLEGDYNDILDWNYYKIPEVLGGGKGYKVDTEEALDKALNESLSQRGEFHLIQVELGKLDFSPALIRFTAKLRAKAGK